MDGAPSITGKEGGVVAKWKDKVHPEDGGLGFTTDHSINHEETLCCKSLKMDQVIEVVIKTVKFIRARGLNVR